MQVLWKIWTQIRLLQKQALRTSWWSVYYNCYRDSEHSSSEEWEEEEQNKLGKAAAEKPEETQQKTADKKEEVPALTESEESDE